MPPRRIPCDLPCGGADDKACPRMGAWENRRPQGVRPQASGGLDTDLPEAGLETRRVSGTCPTGIVERGGNLSLGLRESIREPQAVCSRDTEGLGAEHGGSRGEIRSLSEMCPTGIVERGGNLSLGPRESIREPQAVCPRDTDKRGPDLPRSALGATTPLPNQKGAPKNENAHETMTVVGVSDIGHGPQNGARGGTRTPTDLSTCTSSMRVCHFTTRAVENVVHNIKDLPRTQAIFQAFAK